MSPFQLHDIDNNSQSVPIQNTTKELLTQNICLEDTSHFIQPPSTYGDSNLTSFDLELFRDFKKTLLPDTPIEVCLQFLNNYHSGRNFIYSENSWLRHMTLILPDHAVSEYNHCIRIQYSLRRAFDQLSFIYGVHRHPNQVITDVMKLSNTSIPLLDYIEKVHQMLLKCTYQYTMVEEICLTYVLNFIRQTCPFEIWNAVDLRFRLNGENKFHILRKIIRSLENDIKKFEMRSSFEKLDFTQVINTLVEKKLKVFTQSWVPRLKETISNHSFISNRKNGSGHLATKNKTTESHNTVPTPSRCNLASVKTGFDSKVPHVTKNLVDHGSALITGSLAHSRKDTPSKNLKEEKSLLSTVSKKLSNRPKFFTSVNFTEFIPGPANVAHNAFEPLPPRRNFHTRAQEIDIQSVLSEIIRADDFLISPDQRSRIRQVRLFDQLYILSFLLIMLSGKLLAYPIEIILDLFIGILLPCFLYISHPWRHLKKKWATFKKKFKYYRKISLYQGRQKPRFKRSPTRFRLKTHSHRGCPAINIDNLVGSFILDSGSSLSFVTTPTLERYILEDSNHLDFFEHNVKARGINLSEFDIAPLGVIIPIELRDTQGISRQIKMPFLVTLDSKCPNILGFDFLKGTDCGFNKDYITCISNLPSFISFDPPTEQSQDEDSPQVDQFANNVSFVEHPPTNRATFNDFVNEPEHIYIQLPRCKKTFLDSLRNPCILPCTPCETRQQFKIILTSIAVVLLYLFFIFGINSLINLQLVSAQSYRINTNKLNGVFLNQFPWNLHDSYANPSEPRLVDLNSKKDNIPLDQITYPSSADSILKNSSAELLLIK